MLKAASPTSSFPETADIETSSDNYAQRFSGSIGRWFLEVQENATLNMLKPYTGATVLDIGGGHGQLTEALINQGYQVTVLGSSEICQSRIRHLVEQGLCRFEVGNILDLPFENEAFDVVVSYRLLPHVAQWRPFLAECARAARQAVLLDYPEVRSINYIAPYLFQFKRKLEGNTRPYTCFKKSELLATFAAERFRYQSHFTEFFVPMVLHRTLKSPTISSAVEQVFRLIGFTDLFGSPVILNLIREKEVT